MADDDDAAFVNFFGEPRQLPRRDPLPPRADFVDDVQQRFEQDRAAAAAAGAPMPMPAYEDLQRDLPEPRVDPEALARFRRDMRDPRLVAQLRAVKTHTSPNVPVLEDDGDVELALRVEVTRALRGARARTSLFGVNFLRAVPDQYAGDFVRYLEINGVLQELLPLLHARQPHFVHQRLERSLGEAGCLFADAERLVLPGPFSAHAPREPEERGDLYDDNAHEHYRAPNTVAWRLRYHVPQLYDAEDEPQDNNDDDDDEEDEQNATDRALAANCAYTLYVVCLDAGAVDAEESANDVNSRVLCFRTFYFAPPPPPPSSRI